MQTIWSRVSQARCVCNCPSCLSTTNAVARRAIKATARRTTRVGDVFTFSISSLAAGLAFADSRKKDKRTKQWVKVIGEARVAVEATEIQQQRRLVALSENASSEALDDSKADEKYTVATHKVIKEVEGWDVQESDEQDQRMPIPDDGTDTWLDVFDWAQEQHRLREASGFQNWRGLPLSLLQSLSRAQLNELLSNERLFRRFYGGPDCNSLVDEQSKYPFSVKKKKTLEWSVAKMVLKLLRHCSNNSDSPINILLRKLIKGESTVDSNLAYMNERLRTLHADLGRLSCCEEFESPQAPNYGETRIQEYEQTNKMNISLHELLDSLKPDTDLSGPMSRICFNLLTARTPPNTRTYNMLLAHFRVLERQDLVKAVFTSMRESHIRPNEITHATLLRHFITTDNRVGFVKYWRRMEGYSGALALANPEQEIHPVAKERYLVIGRDCHKAAEKARMNGQVYESLIIGALKFLGDQTAMHYYRNMISEGWSPGLGILLAILQDCCRRLDWTVGTAVLEQLEKTANIIDTLTYEWMLRLCQCCGQQIFFDQILRNGVHCGALPATMLDLPDQVKTEDVAFLIKCAKDLQPRKVTGTLEKTAARISYRLDDKSPFLLENVFHDCEDEDANRRTINRTNHRWAARLALQQRLDEISTDINHTVLQANHALYSSKHLSSIKFWLSRRVKHLEMELEQNANGVAYASHSEVASSKKTKRNRAGRAKGGKGESGKSVDLQVTASFPEDEFEYTSHIPPHDRQGELVHLSPPISPPTDSPKEYILERLRSAEDCHGIGLAALQ